MSDKKLIFAAEGFSVKRLRQAHRKLGQVFAAVKIIERVTDTSFLNFSNFKLSLFSEKYKGTS